MFLVSSCLLWLTPVPALRAQATGTPASLFTFPHFVASQDVSTGIAVFNPNLLEATVTLTLTDADGHTSIKPVTITVPARTQVAKTASEFFPTAAEVDGSLAVSSASAGILVSYQTFDSGGTFLDGAGPVDADYTLFYPVVPGPLEGDSEIDLLNPNIRPAAAELRLWNFNGDLIGWTTVQIPAGGTFRSLATDAFPAGTSFTNASHVTVTAKPLNVFSQAQTLAGTSLFFGFSSIPGPNLLVDLAALNALPLTQLSTAGVLPFFRTGSQYASTLAIANAEPAAVDVNLTAIGNGGSILDTRKITLKPNGGSRTLLQSVFPSLASGEKEGWVLLSASGRTCAAIIHGRSDAASLAAIPLQKSPKYEFIVPQVLEGSGFYTELALANPGSSASSVDVFVAKSSGDTVANTSVTLSPGARISQRLDTLFPEVISQSGGYVYVRASQPLFCSALIGSDSGALLSNIGCQALTVPFIPAARKFFAVSGKVTLDDQPASGFKINLVGPVSGSATSAADGSYLFTNLPAGSYSINIEYPSSLQFVPSSTSFVITTVSWRQDFQGFTKPSVWGIVTMNDEPAAGFQVTLSGPVSQVATSAADGSYLFKELPSGNYSLTITYQAGFQFVPTFVNFDLARASRRQDFVGSTLPNAVVIQPPALTVGSPATAVTIYGRGFNETSQVLSGQVRLTTTFVDPTLLKALIPDYMLALPSRYDLTVSTNAGTPAQVTSTPFTFVVYQANPTLASVTAPGVVVEGGPGATLTLIGTGFLTDTKVKINGVSGGIQTTFISATQILANVPASYFALGGIYPVTVVNSYPTVSESNIVLLSVYYPAPAVQSVSPDAVSARLETGAAPLSIEVLGYGFRRGAVVLCNGEQLATTYCENDAYCLTVHLYATIPPSMLRSSGFAEITVRNPDPSLAVSEAVYMRIDGLQPTITSVVPGSATALNLPDTFAVPVVVYGTNFGPQTLLRIYQSTTDPIPGFSNEGVTVLSSTQLVTTLQVDQTSIGQWLVEVMNPQPGGGQSPVASFFINSGTFVANPFLIVLSPLSVPVGGPAFTLTITGTNFKNGAQVLFNTTLLTTSVLNSQVITAEVPASLLLSAGRIPITVINPDNGGASNRLYIDIR
jgi:hypothetical protein